MIELDSLGNTLRLKNNHVEALVILIAAIITATAMPKLTVLVLPYIFYKLVQLMPLRRIGLLTKTIIVALALISLNTVIGFGAWVLKIPVDHSSVILCYGLLTASLVAFAPMPYPKKNERQLIVQRREIFAMVMAVSVFIITALPLLAHHSASINPILPARIITYGGDNISHLEFFRVIDTHRGYVQDYPKNLTTALSANLIPYPQGWHLNLSIVKGTVELATHKFSVNQVLIFYQLASGLGLALLAYMFVVVGISIQESLKGTSRFTRYLSVISLAALLFVGPFFAFFALGFQTQIASLLLFMAELLILLQLVNTGDAIAKKRLIYLALVLAAGTSYVWFFLWPLALAAIALFIFYAFNINSWQAVLENRKFVVVSSLLACLGTGQLLFQLLYAPTTPTINEPGFIMQPNNLLLLGFALIILTFSFYLYTNAQLRLLSQVVGVSALFSIAVLVYQLIAVGEPRYYYYKSTYTFILLGTLIIAAGMSVGLSSIFKAVGNSRNKRYLIGTALIITALCITTAFGSKEFRLYIQKQPYGMSQELADGVLTLASINPDYGHRIVAIGSCNREQDIKAMRLAVALTGKPSSDQQETINAQRYSPSYRQTFRSIKKELSTEPSLFVVSSDYSLQQMLTQFLGSSARKITFVNLDPGHVAKSTKTCPDLLQ